TCRPIIRRLLMASSDADIQAEMEMEDDFMEELQDRERLIMEKDKALVEKDKTIEEKDKALEEKDKLIKELKEQLAKSQI
ncbi:MAG: hypothetical protein LBU34_12945, partial [Planctomycetaceae bacterium]|nr:hypothetical protein [Planctomycetaceae bacterium]